MSGLGNFLNPNKLLSKDKKLTASGRKQRPEQTLRSMPTFSNELSVSGQSKKQQKQDLIDDVTSQERGYEQEYESARTKNKFAVDRDEEYNDPPQRIDRHKRKKSSEELLEEQEEKFRRNKYTPPNDDSEQEEEPPIPKSRLRTYEQPQPQPQRNVAKKSNDPRVPTKLQLHSVLEQLETQQQVLRKASQQFNRRLRRYIDEEFNKFREAIRQTVEVIFEQFEQSFKQSFELQQQETLEEFARVNDRISEVMGRVEEMLGEIEGTAWRDIVRAVQSEEFQAEVEQAMVMPKEEIGKAVLQIDENRLEEFGQALERLMKVQVVRKKEQSSRRKPNV